MDGKQYFRVEVAIMFAALIVLTGCVDTRHSPKVGAALQQAGPNRGQLEEVLHHYNQDPADSLKLRAAEFLIGNMPRQMSYRGKGLTSYELLSKKLERIQEPYLNKKLDSLYKQLHIAEATRTLHPRSDLKFIKASYLIDNIDQAFDAWRMYPWSQQVPFESFCNYILPYKVYTEPLEHWRGQIRKQFSWLADSLENPGSLREATRRINQAIQSDMRYDGSMGKIPLSLGFSELSQVGVGVCEHLVTYSVYVLRAMGIPAGVDYTYWANIRSGHSWISIKDNKGGLYAFDAMYNNPNQYYEHYNVVPELRTHNDRKVSKIFRRTYKMQLTRLTNIAGKGNIPPLLADRHITEVTNQYRVPTWNISLQVGSDYQKEIAYLAIFKNKQWKRIAYGQRNASGHYDFHNMTSGVVYMPVGYHGETLSYPIIITKTGKVHVLRSNFNQKQTIRISRKYPILSYLRKAQKKMVGGVFQGANRRDFSDAQTLYRIDRPPRPKTNHYTFTNKGPWRYLRFKLSADQCRIAEMSFIQAINGQPPDTLRGTLISSSFRPGDGPKHIIDNKVLSYFVATDTTGGWVGIDLGHPRRVTGVQFYPPNDGNSIEKGDKYKLFYWDHGWKSLYPERQAKKEQLVFRGAPTNALFRIRDLTKGLNERIFTYNHVHQYWY